MDTDEVVIDGSTLEKRRDQRAEQLERFLGGLTPEDRQGIVGTVNQWTEAGGVRVVPASESVFDLEAEDKRLRHYSEVGTFSDPDPIVKRTPGQRLDSMVARIKDAPPETLEPMLHQIAGEYWKAGAPVTVDALRAVASYFLNATERKR
jgi:hypothetical protein